MKIETQPRDDHQVALVVELENEHMESTRRRAARKIAGRVKIPGFRPGKAPYDVVCRHAGEAAVTEEAVELLVDEIYPEVLKQAEIQPAAPGSLEDFNLESLKFTFLVPLAPTVDLADYHAVRLPYEWQVPGEDRLDAAIEELRRLYSTTETVERPVQEGDFVMLDLVGRKSNATEGEAPVFERPGFPVYVRSDEKENEWPFPGFSRQLLGLNTTESKSFSHKYGQDHNEKDLRGQTIEFEVKVKTVRDVQLPELNDEFAKRVGSFENLGSLRGAVRASLEQQSKTEYDDDYFTRLVDKIREGATIQYPPQVLEHESEHVLEELTRRLAEQNLDLEAFLKMRETTRPKFIEEEVKPMAVKRLERSLILDEIVRAEKIEVSKESLNTAFQQTWGEIQTSEGFQKAMRGKSTPPRQLMDAVALESANRLMTSQTLERLKEIATGQAKPPAAAKEPAKARKSSARAKPGAKSAAAPQKRTSTKKVAETKKS